jgi:manganese transport protein
VLEALALEAMGLLILSQVILSFQLPFALVPLVQFTCDKSRMGQFANSWWVAALAWLTAAVIIALNALLIWLIFRGNS